jgi:hypothetical protein
MCIDNAALGRCLRASPSNRIRAVPVGDFNYRPPDGCQMRHRARQLRRPPLTCERAASFPAWAAEPAEALPCLGPLVSAVPAQASAGRLDRSTSQVTCSRSWDFPPASVSGSQGQRKRASERCVQRSLALASCDALRRDKRRPLANDGSTPRLSLHRRDEVAASPARLGGRWSERCALASSWPTVRWVAKQDHHAPMRRT